MKGISGILVVLVVLVVGSAGPAAALASDQGPVCAGSGVPPYTVRVCTP